MSLLKNIEQHPLVAVVIVAAVVAGATWQFLDQVLVRPRDEEFARLQRRIAELEAKEGTSPRTPSLQPSESILEEESDVGTRHERVKRPNNKQVEHVPQGGHLPRSVEGTTSLDDDSANLLGSDLSNPAQNRAASPRKIPLSELPRVSADTQQVQEVDAFTQNEFVKVTILKMAIPKGRDRLTLSLEIENVYDEDLPIAISQYGMEHRRAYLVDELGATFPGRPGDSVSIPGFPALKSSSDPNDYERLSPHEKINIRVIFTSSFGFTSANFNFGAEFVGLVRGDAVPIRISIPNIAFSHQP